MQDVKIYALWGAKQSAVGSPVDAASVQRRLVQVAGDFNVSRDDGMENYSNLTKYGGASDWINSLLGNGNPGLEAMANELAWGLWMHHGGEAVLAAVDEVQTLPAMPAGGTLTFKGAINGALTADPTAEAVQAALEALSTVGAGGVTVTGDGPYVVTFAGAQAGRPQPLIVSTAGAVTRTTAGQKTRHRFVPLAGPGFFGTFFRRVGQEDLQRHRFNDCRISQTQIEASTGTKAVRWTPTIISLDPGEVVATDPTTVMPPANPLLHTDGAGAFTIDGQVFRGLSEWNLVTNEDLNPVYGDDAVPYALVPGNPTVTIASTVYFDDVGIREWNRLVYGTPTPAVGVKPLRRVADLGSYSSSLKQRDQRGDETGDRLDITVPGVKWPIPDAPNPNPDGGTPQVALAGAMRPVGTQDAYTLDVYCDAPAFTI